MQSKITKRYHLSPVIMAIITKTKDKQCKDVKNRNGMDLTEAEDIKKRLLGPNKRHDRLQGLR